MSGEILRAVFDCNIFIQALLNPNSVAAKCLDAVRRGKAELFISKDTLAEIGDVVLRPIVKISLQKLAVNFHQRNQYRLKIHF